MFLLHRKKTGVLTVMDVQENMRGGGGTYVVCAAFFPGGAALPPSPHRPACGRWTSWATSGTATRGPSPSTWSPPRRSASVPIHGFTRTQKNTQNLRNLQNIENMKHGICRLQQSHISIFSNQKLESAVPLLVTYNPQVFTFLALFFRDTHSRS